MTCNDKNESTRCVIRRYWGQGRAQMWHYWYLHDHTHTHTHTHTCTHIHTYTHTHTHTRLCSPRRTYTNTHIIHAQRTPLVHALVLALCIRWHGLYQVDPVRDRDGVGGEVVGNHYVSRQHRYPCTHDVCAYVCFAFVQMRRSNRLSVATWLARGRYDWEETGAAGVLLK